MARAVDQIVGEARRLTQEQAAPVPRHRPADYPPGSVSEVAVIREVTDTVIRWQRIRWKHNPPMIGAADAVEAYGPVQDGYPVEGGTLDAYKPFVYTDDPVGIDAVPFEVSQRGGASILQPAMKLADIVLPPGESLPGCSYG